MSTPPNEEGRACDAAHFTESNDAAKLLAAFPESNTISARARILSCRKPLSSRRCSVCRARVDNYNLRGYSGRSALTGVLYCLRCADGKGPVQ